MNNELRHHGVLGMKWGVRRYQNKDGTQIDIISAHFYFLQSGLFKFFEKLGRFLKSVRTKSGLYGQISGLFAHF